MAQLVKNPPANARDARDVGSVPGWGKFPGEVNGNPLQYSCLENFVDGGAWRATVHGIVKSCTQLTAFVYTHTQTHTVIVHCMDTAFNYSYAERQLIVYTVFTITNNTERLPYLCGPVFTRK